MTKHQLAIKKQLEEIKANLKPEQYSKFITDLSSISKQSFEMGRTINWQDYKTKNI